MKILLLCCFSLVLPSTFLCAAMQQARHRARRAHPPLLRATGNSAGTGFTGQPPGGARHPEGGADQHGAPWPAEGVGRQHLPQRHRLLDLQEDGELQFTSTSLCGKILYMSCFFTVD